MAMHRQMSMALNYSMVLLGLHSVIPVQADCLRTLHLNSGVPLSWGLFEVEDAAARRFEC
jgi:hypothetical protein